MFNYCEPKKLKSLTSKTYEDGKRFYTLPSGILAPSVTTVLSATPKPYLEAWRQKIGVAEAHKQTKIASSRGSNLHTLCENYLNNNPLGKTMPDALEMFLSVKPLLDRIDNIHYQEQTLWSEAMILAGRVDCVAEFDGVLSVIDFKTSKRIKTLDMIEDYFIQTTAYSLMYENLIGVPINNLVIIMSVDHEQALVFQQRPYKYIPKLITAIKTYKETL